MDDNLIDDSIIEKISYTLHNNKYMSTLGIEIIELKKGYAKGRIELNDIHLNPYGSVHGGCLYSLADTISGFAACTLGDFASTISGNMNYIRPAINTKNIYCTAKKIRQGNSIAFYDIEITDDNGTILDTGSFSFYLLKNTSF